MDFGLMGISVGKQFEIFRLGDVKGVDCAMFEALEFGQGYIMPIYLSGMTSEEVQVMKKQQILTRVYRDGNKMLPMISFGLSGLIFELEFYPSLYHDNRGYQMLGGSNIVNMIGIDSNTNIIKFIRSANMPKKLWVDWSQSLEFFKNESYEKEYKEWVDYIHDYIIIENLWNNATFTGLMGEKW